DLLPYVKSRTTRCVIAKLVVAASAYYVWQERNWRLFQKGKRSIDQVVECIKSVVRLKLLSCKLKKSKSGERLAKLWDLPEAVFFCVIREMEKPNEDSNASRKLNASLIKNVDGRILGKDGKPLRSAMRKPTGPNPKFGPKPIESNLNKESLAPNQDNFPVLGSDVISRVSGISNTQKPSMQDSTKDKGIQTATVNSDVFWSDSNVTNANVSGSSSVTKEQDASKPMNSFAAVLQDQPLKKVVKIKEMRSEENVEGAAVTLPFEAFEAVNARFINTLIGYFIGE
ncbi:hypothetical protein Tco_1287838, partial [Tanacetum coccineum]